jgi:hypothetical protein
MATGRAPPSSRHTIPRSPYRVSMVRSGGGIVGSIGRLRSLRSTEQEILLNPGEVNAFALASSQGESFVDGKVFPAGSTVKTPVFQDALVIDPPMLAHVSGHRERMLHSLERALVLFEVRDLMAGRAVFGFLYYQAVVGRCRSTNDSALGAGAFSKLSGEGAPARKERPQISVRWRQRWKPPVLGEHVDHGASDVVGAFSFS